MNYDLDLDDDVEQERSTYTHILTLPDGGRIGLGDGENIQLLGFFRRMGGFKLADAVVEKTAAGTNDPVAVIDYYLSRVPGLRSRIRGSKSHECMRLKELARGCGYII